MFLFTKTLETLIFPPGVFLFLALVAAILWLFRLKKSAGVLLILGTVGLYLASIEPVASSLIRPLEDAYPPLSARTPLPNVQAVVVLGGGSVAGAPDAAPVSQPSAEAAKGASTTVPASLSAASTRRLVYGYVLARERNLPIVVAGGAPLKAPGTESEAQAARTLLERLGMPADRIRIETESRDTWENAADITKRFHLKKIILVTSAYHMPRAVYSFRKQDIDVVAAPTDYLIDRDSAGYIRYLPSLISFEASATALREQAGRLFYRVRYGRLPSPGSSGR